MFEFDEIIDVVDVDNNIIRQAPRYEVHNKRLMHRSVHILVFNSQGNLFLQKRSMTKDENPGLWDTSAAGLVDSGEDYLHCAKRELNLDYSPRPCSKHRDWTAMPTPIRKGRVRDG